MLRKWIAILSATLFFTGCSGINGFLRPRTLSVIFVADPASACLYLNNVPCGPRAFRSVSVRLTDDQLMDGRYVVTVPEARWPSGAVTAQCTRTLELNDLSQRVVIHHPDPGSPAWQFDRLETRTVTIGYYSEPAMALIFNDRSYLGRSPVRLTYSYSFADYQRGFFELQAMQARWVSGATIRSEATKVMLPQSSLEITLIRPEYPDLDLDLDFIRRADEKNRLEKAAAKNHKLIEHHYLEMEKIEKEKLLLEKKKLELLEKQQAAEEKERQELFRLKKLKVAAGPGKQPASS